MKISINITKTHLKYAVIYLFLIAVSAAIYLFMLFGTELAYRNWVENINSIFSPWPQYIYSHLIGLPIAAITFLLVSWSVKFKRNRDFTKRQKTTAIVVLVVVVGHFLMMLMGSNLACTTSMLGLYIVLDIYFKPVRGGGKVKKQCLN